MLPQIYRQNSRADRPEYERPGLAVQTLREGFDSAAQPKKLQKNISVSQAEYESVAFAHGKWGGGRRGIHTPVAGLQPGRKSSGSPLFRGGGIAGEAQDADHSRPRPISRFAVPSRSEGPGSRSSAAVLP
jgi:hypothetical protein